MKKTILICKENDSYIAKVDSSIILQVDVKQPEINGDKLLDNLILLSKQLDTKFDDFDVDIVIDESCQQENVDIILSGEIQSLLEDIFKRLKE